MGRQHHTGYIADVRDHRRAVSQLDISYNENRAPRSDERTQPAFDRRKSSSQNNIYQKNVRSQSANPDPRSHDRHPPAAAPYLPPGLVSMSGWLYYRDQTGLKQWRKRWCEIVDTRLICYKKPESNPLVGFDLTRFAARVVKGSKKFALKLEREGDRDHIFAAEDRDSMITWLRKMQRASAVPSNTRGDHPYDMRSGSQFPENEHPPQRNPVPDAAYPYRQSGTHEKRVRLQQDETYPHRSGQPSSPPHHSSIADIPRRDPRDREPIQRSRSEFPLNELSPEHDFRERETKRHSQVDVITDRNGNPVQRTVMFREFQTPEDRRGAMSNPDQVTSHAPPQNPSMRTDRPSSSAFSPTDDNHIASKMKLDKTYSREELRRSVQDDIRNIEHKRDDRVSSVAYPGSPEHDEPVSDLGVVDNLFIYLTEIRIEYAILENRRNVELRKLKEKGISMASCMYLEHRGEGSDCLSVSDRVEGFMKSGKSNSSRDQFQTLVSMSKKVSAIPPTNTERELRDLFARMIQMDTETQEKFFASVAAANDLVFDVRSDHLVYDIQSAVGRVLSERSILRNKSGLSDSGDIQMLSNRILTQRKRLLLELGEIENQWNHLKQREMHQKRYDPVHASRNSMLAASRESLSGSHGNERRTISGSRTSLGRPELPEERKNTTAPKFEVQLSNVEVREGDQAELSCVVSGSEPMDVNWQREDLLILDSPQTRVIRDNGRERLIVPDVQVLDSGTFHCIAENAAGKVVSTCNLNVLPAETPEEKVPPPISPKPVLKAAPAGSAPVIDQKPISISTVPGQEVRFVSSVSGYPEPLVRWYFDNQILSASGYCAIFREGRSCILTLRNVTPSMNGKISVEAENAHGRTRASCQLSVTAKKETPKPPLIVSKLANVSVVEGDDITMKCKIESDLALIVTWYKDGSPLKPGASDRLSFDSDGKDSYSLLIDEVNCDDQGIYMCEAMNKSGRVCTSAELRVFPSSKPVQQHKWFVSPSSQPQQKHPPIILEQLRSEFVEIGESAVFRARLAGYPQPEVTWLKDGKQFVFTEGMHGEVHGDEYRLIIKRCAPGDSGLYALTAENAYGRATSAANLEVQLAPPLPPRPGAAADERVGATDLEVISELADVEAGLNEMVELTCYISCGPQTRVDWLRDNRTLSDGPMHYLTRHNEKCSLTIMRFQAPDIGKYTCIASDPSGRRVSTSGVLRMRRQGVDSVDGGRVSRTVSNSSLNEVSEPPLQVVERLKDKLAFAGQAITLSCRIHSPLPAVTTWYKGESVLTNNGNVLIANKGDFHSLLITTAHAEDSDVYTCFVEDASGRHVSTSARVEVKPEARSYRYQNNSASSRLSMSSLGSVPGSSVSMQNVSTLSGESDSPREGLFVRSSSQQTLTADSDVTRSKTKSLAARPPVIRSSHRRSKSSDKSAQKRTVASTPPSRSLNDDSGIDSSYGDLQRNDAYTSLEELDRIFTRDKVPIPERYVEYNDLDRGSNESDWSPGTRMEKEMIRRRVQNVVMTHAMEAEAGQPSSRSSAEKLNQIAAQAELGKMVSQRSQQMAISSQQDRMRLHQNNVTNRNSGFFNDV